MGRPGKDAEEEFTRQLQNDYGIDPVSGDVTPMERLTYLDDVKRETAKVLRETLEHYLVSADVSTPAKAKKARQETLNRIIREQAFTVLNRLCALRMAEARGLLLESLARGYQSKGFQLYQRMAGASLGETGDAYRMFLFSLFDEFAVELSVLFDRFSPQGRLFPRETALLSVLEQINHPDIDPLWTEDETIGWIYQYFNSSEERKQMRAESSAPRNSRELAVRNQFFTPRYVVEFLADNTLGRLWYEMTKGQTSLAERCQYMVKRPQEVFLQAGETAPEESGGDNLSQKELLNLPVYIPHRPLKHPKEIRMLDPACGSMHFGLYSFDLFEVIYKEYRDLHLGDDCDYEDKDIPKLIIENNIHGIDIDPRAAQIAGLSLWLRAQRSWKEQGVRALDRPQIEKSNVVCAEPMPGEEDMLEEFTSQLQPRVLGQLVRDIFEKMKLAGEAGSLLKIEEEIRDAIAEAHRKYNAFILQQKGDDGFLPGMAPKHEPTLFDYMDLPKEEDFWETAEARVLEAIRDYAEQASEKASQRRLFAADAARGFAFIDICRKRYDVALMNPPFGEFSKLFKPQAREDYPDTYNDIFAAFIERSLDMLVPGGKLGAITSRSGFYLGSFENWRANILLKKASLRLLTDLGNDVMDAAMVEAAAYCLDKGTESAMPAVFARLLGKPDREGLLLETIRQVNGGMPTSQTFLKAPQDFRQLDGAPFAYWIETKTLKAFSKYEQTESNICTVRGGLSSGDNFRYVRLLWEIPSENIYTRWKPHVLSGCSQPWYSPILVTIDWKQNGRVVSLNPASRIGGMEFYEQPGLSWTRRAVRMLPYAIPAGCIPSRSRYMIFPHTGKEAVLLGYLGSNVVSAYLRCFGEWFTRPNFLTDTLKALPWPGEAVEAIEELQAFVRQQILRRRNMYQGYEPFQEFALPACLNGKDDGENPLVFDFRHLLPADLDSQVAASLGISEAEAQELCRDLMEAIECRNGSAASEDGDEEEDESNPLGDDPASPLYQAKAVLSYAVGCAFGRWDIRIATGEKQAAQVTEPFAPLPQYSPGCLMPEDFQAIRQRNLAYPLPLHAHGIIVESDDEAALTRGVQQVLQVIFGEQSGAKETSLCQELSVNTLQDYFQKSQRFFMDHLAVYSKSRRVAPIYWPLSTASGSYTLWVYYHRLTNQTLFSCINDFVEPRQRRLNEALEHLRLQSTRSRQEEREMEQLANQADELRDFHDELLRIAQFWKPDLNDGVEITAAPLWRLFRHRPWQQRLKKTWEKLEAGEYDWSHLALSIWPERVVRASHKDHSCAIAHDLEDALWEEVETTRMLRGGREEKRREWRPRELTETEMRQIVETVKAR